MKLDTNTQTLFLTAGPGLENCDIEQGQLEVRYEGGVRQFDNIIAAIKFYYYLDEEASIWDVADQPTLIESKFIVGSVLSVKETE